jgi:hypothetical protein
METTPEKPGWCTIDIRTAEGPRPLMAVVFGQWAAHDSHDGTGWHVTHTRTGMAVPRFGLTEYQARRIAHRLSETVPELQVLTWWDDDGIAPSLPKTLQREHVEAIKSAVSEAGA